MHYKSAEFGVDSSSRFSFIARTHRQTRERVTDATGRPVSPSFVAGIDTILLRLRWRFGLVATALDASKKLLYVETR